jgi:hypothetical protein
LIIRVVGETFREPRGMDVRVPVSLQWRGSEKWKTRMLMKENEERSRELKGATKDIASLR